MNEENVHINCGWLTNRSADRRAMASAPKLRHRHTNMNHNNTCIVAYMNRNGSHGRQQGPYLN